MRWSEQGVQVIARAGRHLAVALTPCLGACANGEGEGEASGPVSAPECGIDDTAWELRPNFFVQDPWENTAVIRVQRGSNYQDLSNGLVISISDVEEVRGSFGTPIDLSAEDSPRCTTLARTTAPRPAPPSTAWSWTMAKKSRPQPS